MTLEMAEAPWDNLRFTDNNPIFQWLDENLYGGIEARKMLSPKKNISTLPFFSQQSLNRNKNSFSFLFGYIFPQLTFLLTKNSLTLKVSSTNFSKYLNLIKKNCSLYILKGLLKVIKSYYVTRVGKKEDDQKEMLKLTIILELLEW